MHDDLKQATSSAMALESGLTFLEDIYDIFSKLIA
jgi:hypothetical protein